MKTISVKLSEPLAGWLSRRSKALRRTQSQVVRELLDRERNGKERSETCAERLRDLGGFFDGPRDLSTNPRHMEGFGR
jgi:hypothetical protein